MKLTQITALCIAENLERSFISDDILTLFQYITNMWRNVYDPWCKVNVETPAAIKILEKIWNLCMNNDIKSQTQTSEKGERGILST